MNTLPKKQGLYNPKNEHDACGLGFVAHIKGQKSHSIVQQGLTILKRITHRGAVGADPKAGDGAGLLMQIPDVFFQGDATEFSLPSAGEYGVGMVFLPKDGRIRAELQDIINSVIEEIGQTVIGWRKVPVDASGLGESVKPTEPSIYQVFVGKGDNVGDQDAFERKLFVIHKALTARVNAEEMDGSGDFYICSMSSRTIVYKGMLLADQVGDYYLDLQNETVTSALALVHQRFSTNTFPTWDLAHPFRMIAHNGEINTNRGNKNWMAARQSSMKSELIGDDMEKIWPVIPADQSDTAALDNALELMVAGGYSLTEAMTMLMPEAWYGNDHMSEDRFAYYEYNAAVCVLHVI